MTDDSPQMLEIEPRVLVAVEDSNGEPVSFDERMARTLQDLWADSTAHFQRATERARRANL